jgi:hypothetical protein
MAVDSAMGSSSMVSDSAMTGSVAGGRMGGSAVESVMNSS